MAKKTKKEQLVVEQTIEELAEKVSENLRVVYHTLLRKGFTPEQAFELLVLVVRSE